MKSSLILLILVIGYITCSNGEVDPRCPLDEDESSIVTLLPHESDCTKYYACTHGQLVEMQCKKGLLFNPEYNVSN